MHLFHHQFKNVLVLSAVCFGTVILHGNQMLPSLENDWMQIHPKLDLRTFVVKPLLVLKSNLVKNGKNESKLLSEINSNYYTTV